MDVASALQAGTVVPYLGPEALLLAAANLQIPSNPAALAERLTRRVAVPSRIRRNLTAAAQYIENFRHRKTLRKLMLEAFALPAQPGSLPSRPIASAAPASCRCWWISVMTPRARLPLPAAPIGVRCKA